MYGHLVFNQARSFLVPQVVWIGHPMGDDSALQCNHWFVFCQCLCYWWMNSEDSIWEKSHYKMQYISLWHNDDDMLYILHIYLILLSGYIYHFCTICFAMLKCHISKDVQRISSAFSVQISPRKHWKWHLHERFQNVSWQTGSAASYFLINLFTPCLL